MTLIPRKLIHRTVTRSGYRLLLAVALTATFAAPCVASAAVLPGAASAAAAPNAAAAQPSRTEPLVVHTGTGAVRGLYTSGAREFLGIPYAAPPVGALRWQPPQPAAPWAGIRDATSPASTCAQTGSLATGVITTSTAEDCLYLNIYTPRTASRAELPVMVWIHGGGFTGGSGSIYDGSVMAAQGHAVVVTINYRLSAFGFLALPGLGAGASGDYGLLDQQAALRWVQRNARAFGGNPHDVTEFGESAGAASVCDNMASPAAAGLFQRAIAESGCLLAGPSRQAAETQGAALAAKLGCTDPATQVACLRAKPAADILQAENGMSWAPATGGPVLPVQAADAFAAGRYAHVPLIQGTNRDEGRFFAAVLFDGFGHPLTAAQYPGVIQGEFGASAAPAILARYPLSAYASPDLAFAQVFTDSMFSCPALRADQLARRSGVYAYEFSDPNPPDDLVGLNLTFPLGAAHSSELQYVFQRIPYLDTLPPFTPAQLALSNQMIAYWTRFAATGNPSAGWPVPAPAAAGPGARAPYWPRFTASHPQILQLRPDGTAPESATAFSAAHQCGFWAAVPTPSL